MGTAADKYRSEFARRYVSEGEAIGAAKAILKILAERDIDVSDEQRNHILACTCEDTLTTWLRISLTAASTDELFPDRAGSAEATTENSIEKYRRYVSEAGEKAEVWAESQSKAEAWIAFLSSVKARNTPEASVEIFCATKAESKIRCTAEAVLYVLDTRGISASEGDRARITACRCPDTLVTWLARAVAAGASDTADRIIS